MSEEEIILGIDPGTASHWLWTHLRKTQRMGTDGFWLYPPSAQAQPSLSLSSFLRSANVNVVPLV